jgi:hypothetical protein
MKRILKSDQMHPADIEMLESGEMDAFLDSITVQREPQPLEAQDFLSGMKELADAIRNVPAPVVKVAVAPPQVTVNVSPEVKAVLPPVVESTRLLRNERGLITGSVKEVEQKPE